MRFYIIAGEKSGDDHGAGLVNCFNRLDENTTIRGVGGDAMSAAGVDLFHHFGKAPAMGIIEVIPKLRSFRRLIKNCRNDIIEFSPDAVILIDFGAFNLGVARFCHIQGIKVFYFIPPKIWAWGSWRLKNLRQHVDRVFVTLPFELAYFEDHGCRVTFHGSPLKKLANNSNSSDYVQAKKRVLLYPGSRNQEVRKHLPVLLAVAREFPEYEFVVLRVDTVATQYYEQQTLPPNTSYSSRQTDELMSAASAAIVTSGTATLEVGFRKIPMMVIYKTSWLTYLVARLLLRVKYISLINLIGDRAIVKEFIQRDCNVHVLARELDKLVEDRNYQQNIINGYNEIVNQFPDNDTYWRVAEDMVAEVRLSSSKFAQA